MQFVAEYLQQAVHFERMAEQCHDAVLKEKLLMQAADYRKLAKKRAAQVGLPDPTPPPAKE